MLANSTMSDSGQPVGDQSSTTPCRMVSESAPGGRGRGQHRQEVGRDVADRRGDQEGPGALEAGGLAELECLAAARAVPFVLAGRGTREQAAASQLCRPCCIAVRRRRSRRRLGHPCRGVSRPRVVVRPLDPLPHLARVEARLDRRRTRTPARRARTARCPGSPWRSSAILMSATSTPSSMTSIMLQVRVVG